MCTIPVHLAQTILQIELAKPRWSAQDCTSENSCPNAWQKAREESVERKWAH